MNSLGLFSDHAAYKVLEVIYIEIYTWIIENISTTGRKCVCYTTNYYFRMVLDLHLSYLCQGLV